MLRRSDERGRTGQFPVPMTGAKQASLATCLIRPRILIDAGGILSLWLHPFSVDGRPISRGGLLTSAKT